MATERDIAGSVLALVGAWEECSKSEVLLPKLNPEERLKMKASIEKGQELMKSCAIDLVTTFMVDVNRIANALEQIADNTGDRSIGRKR